MCMSALHTKYCTTRRVLDCHYSKLRRITHNMCQQSLASLQMVISSFWRLPTSVIQSSIQRTPHPLPATDPGGIITMVTASGRSFTQQINTEDTAVQKTNQLPQENLCLETDGHHRSAKNAKECSTHPWWNACQGGLQYALRQVIFHFCALHSGTICPIFLL